MGISFLFSLPLAFLLFSAICKASSDNHFAFLNFFSWGWSWSLPCIQCQEPLSIVLQAFCLLDLILWIYMSLPLYNCKVFYLGHLNGLVVFPTLFNLSLNLAIRSSWSEPQSVPSLVFADCIDSPPSLAAKNIINLILVLTIWWCPCVESSLASLEEGVCYDQCHLLTKLC